MKQLILEEDMRRYMFMKTKYDVGDIVSIKGKVTDINIKNDGLIIYRIELPLIEGNDIMYLPEEMLEGDKE